MKGILLNVQHQYHAFSVKEKIVADALMKDSGQVLSSTITEYAETINTSPATITRFCKKLGLSGYPELKLLLASSNKSKEFSVGSIELTENHEIETPEGIINDVLTNTMASLNKLSKLFETKELENAVNAIAKSRRILICGVGASGVVAKDFHQKLVRIGIISYCNDDLDLAKVMATSFTQDDLVIAFSYSGSKQEIQSIVKIAASKGATIIAVTRAGNTPIAASADIHIPVAPSEAIVRNGATVSRLQMLIVVDVLYQMLIKIPNEKTLETLKETWRNVAKEDDDAK